MEMLKKHTFHSDQRYFEIEEPIKIGFTREFANKNQFHKGLKVE